MPIRLVRMTELRSNPQASSVSYAAYLKHRSIVWFQESFLAAPCIVKHPVRPSTQGRFVMSAADRKPALTPSEQPGRFKKTEQSDKMSTCPTSDDVGCPNLVTYLPRLALEVTLSKGIQPSGRSLIICVRLDENVFNSHT